MQEVKSQKKLDKRCTFECNYLTVQFKDRAIYCRNFWCLFSFILIIHLPFMAPFYSAFYILITISLMHLFDGNCKTLMPWIQYMMIHAVGFCNNAPDVTIFNQLYTTAIKYILTKVWLNQRKTQIYLSYFV